MLLLAEYRHQSNVTLSEQFPCSDWQVISEDKLCFDLPITRHNRSTKEAQRQIRDRKKSTSVTSQMLLQLISPGVAAESFFSLRSCLELWMAKA